MEDKTVEEILLEIDDNPESTLTSEEYIKEIERVLLPKEPFQDPTLRTKL